MKESLTIEYVKVGNAIKKVKTSNGITATTTYSYDKLYQLLDDEDWIICTKDNGIYKASGGLDKLEEILLIFKKWVENEQ